MTQLRQDWSKLLEHWAVDSERADQAFDVISHAYASEGRHYHTLEHIHEVLKTVEALESTAVHCHALKLAAWLHDVVYDSKASDNEERSAAFAQQLCHDLSIPEGAAVASLIQKTKTHVARQDPDAQILIDADLAILGASEAQYQTYAERIRQEYAWVPEADYRQGRRRVLESFLGRAKIYHLLSRLEEPARRNLAAEIARPGR
jgi:predicted metal-dependent HD superfamily phosphohydrolase